MEERKGTIAWAFCYWWPGELQWCVQCTLANNSSKKDPTGAMANRSWFAKAGSYTAACRATARSLVSNFSDTTKCHLNLLLLRLQTFCWFKWTKMITFYTGAFHASPHGVGTSWLCGIVNSQDGTQGTSLPNFTYQSLVPLLPICKNTIKTNYQIFALWFFFHIAKRCSHKKGSYPEPLSLQVMPFVRNSWLFPDFSTQFGVVC